MCGFVGYVSIKEFDLTQSLESMSKRGPDNVSRTVWENDNIFVGLGHTRLGILGLEQASNQPFECETGDITLVFNGEIYNYLELKSLLKNKGYKFFTNSDTEVLVAAFKAWGPKVFQKLEGMYSGCFLVKSKKQIYLFRDQFGIKPIYYCNSETGFFFGSTPEAVIKAVNTKFNINKKVLASYLCFGDYEQTNETFFANVFSVPSGTYAEINVYNPTLDFKRFSNLNFCEDENYDNEDKAQKKLYKLLTDSVNKHLRADVPSIVALSGGLDSSIVTSVASKIDPKIQTITFSSNDCDVNELNWAERVNSVTKTVSIIVPGEEINLESLTRLILAQGEPIAGPSGLAQMRIYENMKRKNFKVVLEGQGADEMFAGYDGYPEYSLLTLLGHFKLASAINYYNKVGKRLGYKKINKKILSLFIPLLVKKNLDKWKLEKFTKLILSPIFSEVSCRTYVRRSYFRFGWRNCLKAKIYDAVFFETLPRLLRHADRNSMWYSVESRVPFLNFKIFQFLMSVPSYFFISDGDFSKTLLRRAFKNTLPIDVIYRSDKIGFEYGKIEIYRDFFINEIFKSYHDNSMCRVIFKKDMHKKTKELDTLSLWRILNVCIWVDCNKEILNAT